MVREVNIDTNGFTQNFPEVFPDKINRALASVDGEMKRLAIIQMAAMDKDWLHKVLEVAKPFYVLWYAVDRGTRNNDGQYLHIMIDDYTIIFGVNGIFIRKGRGAPGGSQEIIL